MSILPPTTATSVLKIYRQLAGPKVYKPIPADLSATLCNTLNGIISNALNDGTINNRLAKFLGPNNPCIPVYPLYIPSQRFIRICASPRDT